MNVLFLMWGDVSTAYGWEERNINCQLVYCAKLWQTSTVWNLCFLNVCLFLPLDICEHDTCSSRCGRKDAKMQNFRKKIRSRMGHHFNPEHFRALLGWERSGRQLWLSQTEFPLGFQRECMLPLRLFQPRRGDSTAWALWVSNPIPRTFG